MDLVLPQPLLAAWLYAFFRLLGWAWLDPLMSRLPWSLRVLVAGMLAWVWTPAMLETPITEPFSAPGLAWLGLSFMAGAAMGFAARVLVAVAQAALAYLGLAANQGLTQHLDGQTGFEQPGFEQHGGLETVAQSLGWWLALLGFFAANGHLLLLQALHESFAALPVQALATVGTNLDAAKLGAAFFGTAAQLALPALVLVLLAQLSVALMSRLLPGVNGFSAGMTLAVFALLGGLAMLSPVLVGILTARFAALAGVVSGFAP